MSVPYLREAAHSGDSERLIRFVRLHFGDGNENVGRKEIDKSWIEALKILLRYEIRFGSSVIRFEMSQGFSSGPDRHAQKGQVFNQELAGSTQPRIPVASFERSRRGN